MPPGWEEVEGAGRILTYELHREASESYLAVRGPTARLQSLGRFMGSGLGKGMCGTLGRDTEGAGGGQARADHRNPTREDETSRKRLETAGSPPRETARGRGHDGRDAQMARGRGMRRRARASSLSV